MMSQRIWWRYGVAIFGAVLATSALLAGLFWSDGNSKGSGLSSTDSGEGLVVQKPENCIERYNVVLDLNEGEKVLSEGLPPGTPEQKLQFVVDKAQHEPRVLQVAWNNTPAGQKKPVDWRKLIENGCYSQLGRDTYQRVVGIYEAATVVNDDAPATGVNTGATPGGDVYQIPGGISGDRSGIKVTFPNGKEIWIMNRCGNIVTKGPQPGIPVKPPPTTVPTTVSPTTTTLKPKNPGESTQVNPSIPPQGQGPGTTPVGQDPGPEEPTYDTPCGLATCPPPPSTSPPPVPTTQPPAPPPPGGENPGPIESP